MPLIGLATYTLQVLTATGQVCSPVGAFHDKKDLLAVVNEYLEARKSTIAKHDAAQTALRTTRSTRSGRSISGIIERGEFGFSSTLLDTDKAQVAYNRRPQDADLLPHYFLLDAPRLATQAVLILERFGQSGIKGTLEIDLDAYFREDNPGFRLRFSPLVPRQLFDLYLKKGRLIRVRLVKYGAPSDIADKFDKGHNETEVTTEIRITAHRGGTVPLLQRLRPVLDGRKDASEFIQLRSIEYDTVKIELEISGTRRTINLDNPDSLRATTDVTQEVDITSNGHPDFASIDRVAREILADVNKALRP